MKVRAIVKNTGVPARTVRPILDVIRGKKAEEALTILKFAPSPKARIVSKVVKSAMANAENNYQLIASDLKIADIYANDAPMLKRFKARSRGQSSPILKRSSHITVVVTEEEI